jgi:hypothetical protein
MPFSDEISEHVITVQLTYAKILTPLRSVLKVTAVKTFLPRGQVSAEAAGCFDFSLQLRTR